MTEKVNEFLHFLHVLIAKLNGSQIISLVLILCFFLYFGWRLQVQEASMLSNQDYSKLQESVISKTQAALQEKSAEFEIKASREHMSLDKRLSLLEERSISQQKQLDAMEEKLQAIFSQLLNVRRLITSMNDIPNRQKNSLHWVLPPIRNLFMLTALPLCSDISSDSRFCTPIIVKPETEPKPVGT